VTLAALVAFGLGTKALAGAFLGHFGSARQNGRTRKAAPDVSPFSCGRASVRELVRQLKLLVARRAPERG